MYHVVVENAGDLLSLLLAVIDVARGSRDEIVVTDAKDRGRPLLHLFTQKL